MNQPCLSSPRELHVWGWCMFHMSVLLLLWQDNIYVILLLATVGHHRLWSSRLCLDGFLQATEAKLPGCCLSAVPPSWFVFFSNLLKGEYLMQALLMNFITTCLNKFPSLICEYFFYAFFFFVFHIMTMVLLPPFSSVTSLYTNKLRRGQSGVRKGDPVHS